MRRRTRWIPVLLAFAATASVPAYAQQPEPEGDAQLLDRTGALLSAGYWFTGLEPADGVSASGWPWFSVAFSRALGEHLALENTVGLLRRRELETAGGLRGPARVTRTSHLVPLLTGVRWYPLTRPGALLEPSVGGAAGLAIGIEDHEGGGGELLGSGTGPTGLTGLAAAARAALDYHPFPVLSIDLTAGYQWVRFGQTLGPTRTYRGLLLTAGIEYRFHY